MINYNLRVLLASSRTLDALVQQGLLRRVHEQVPGASGEVFTVFGEQPEMLSHFHLRLGQNLIQAQLYTLPPEEYAGMLAASPAFTQNRVAHLLPALARPMSPEDKAIWVSSLVQAIQAGACPDSTPHLLAGRNVPLAHWFPEQTRFFRNSSGWFVSLFFAPPALAPLQGIDRSAVGIDVGLNTLAVSVYQSGLIHRAAGIQEVYLSAMELEQWCPDDTQTQQEVERHLRLLQHAAARLELHNMVSVLLSSASTVYWEDLHYRDCSPAFKRGGHSLAAGRAGSYQPTVSHDAPQRRAGQQRSPPLLRWQRRDDRRRCERRPQHPYAGASVPIRTRNEVRTGTGLCSAVTRLSRKP